MVTENGLRTRLAKVSVDDIDAVHALYLDSKKLLKAVGKQQRQRLSAIEVIRRVERTLGLSLRAAQRHGRVLSRGQRPGPGKGASVTSYLPPGYMATYVYGISDGISDEMFDKAVAECVAAGNLGRETLFQAVKDLKVITPAVDAKPVVPTPRGRRTIEHMSIQINAIALGVVEVDPAEVDKSALEGEIFQVFEDIGTIRAFLRRVNKCQ